MKKIYPYILPTIALIIILVLTIKWYTNRTDQNGNGGTINDGVQIEDITTDQADEVLKGSTDVKKVKLTGSEDASGEVRYEFKDEKVYFSVSLSAAEVDQGGYEVWLRSPEDDSKKRAFIMEFGKAGYFGSAAVPKDILPVEIVVTREEIHDLTMEEVIVSGTIEADK